MFHITNFHQLIFDCIDTGLMAYFANVIQALFFLLKEIVNLITTFLFS